MSVQQFCLRWNNHQPNFISVFSALLHNENLVDVTLAAEGNQLQAHKVVLSACSTYFETLFILNPCKHPIVILKDVRYNDLKTLVDFMYYGEVNVSQERLPHIIKTAEMLKIKGLAEMSDAASLSKSDPKASAGIGVGEQLSAGNLNDGESVWQSQHQQQQHPQFQQQDSQHQQQPPQQQQPSQQQNQLQPQQQQQQQLHLLHHHHQQHQARRTPSPTTMSPATRRKRLRKSSTGLEFSLRKEAQQQAPVATYATEEEFRHATGTTSSGEEPATSMEGIATMTGGPTNIHIAHLDTMTTFGGANPNSLAVGGGGAGGSGQRLIKEDMDHSHQHAHHHNPHHQSHHDVDVDEQQQHIIMKSESHELQPQQTLPLDITTSGGVSVGGQSGCGAQHTGVQWTTVVEPSYPRFALTPCQTIGISAGNPNNHNTNNPSNSSSNNTTTTSGVQHHQQQHAQHQQQQQGQSVGSHHGNEHQHHSNSTGVVTHSNGAQAGGGGGAQNASTNSDVVNQSSASSGGSSRDDGASGLQYQQQGEGSSSGAGAAYQSTSGSSQIINSYPQSISTPTSPQCTDSTLVQSVYSQGTTPIQSPTSGAAGGSTSNTRASANSTTSKRKRSVNPQGDENFIRALEAVRYGGIGFCKAARLFGVNNRTLWLEYRKRGYPISRPSIKSRVKQEPDASPQPTTPVTKEEPKMETSSSSYEHIAAAATNSGTPTPGQGTPTANIGMPIVGATEGGTSIMCPPHAHVMSFLDARHVEFPGTAIHPTMRQRYPETTSVNVNPGETSSSLSSKRGRLLIRQPRVKKDGDLHTQYSAEIYQIRVPHPRIERHASEPAPSHARNPHQETTTQPNSSLSVPQSSHLVKQHSHPLLPSQTMSNTPIVVHRQLSQPGQRSRVSLHHPLHRLTPQSSFESASSSLLAVNTYADSCLRTPPSIRVDAAPRQSPTEATVSGPQSPHLLMTTATQSEDQGVPPPIQMISSTDEREISVMGHYRIGSGTPPMLIVSGPATGSLDYVPALRVKDELQRSISTPQVLTREFSLDNPRSSHCPAIRPGPALGCNFCWNTIDTHGRILRRKTKYHCPECQTNLCIVPCFQEYHERQTNEQASAITTTSTITSTTTTTTTTGTPLRDSSPVKQIATGESTSPSQKTKPSLKFPAFGTAASSSTASSASSIDSGGSQSASTIQRPPEFSRGSSLQ